MRWVVKMPSIYIRRDRISAYVKEIEGPFRPRPGYHPADPRNWLYSLEEAEEKGLLHDVVRRGNLWIHIID
jgi:hypothetical protein